MVVGGGALWSLVGSGRKGVWIIFGAVRIAEKNRFFKQGSQRTAVFRLEGDEILSDMDQVNVLGLVFTHGGQQLAG